MSTKDGGPAFPVEAWEDDSVEPSVWRHANGMSLRDYFVGQLLSCHGFNVVPGVPEFVAERCYTLAEALLRERERR